MERKDFLKNSLGVLGISTLLLDSCKKDSAKTIVNTSFDESEAKACVPTPKEVEGPYPYPGGEITNPLQRANITEDQDGISFIFTLGLINLNSNCTPVSGARIDVWHCNKDGYYSGYGNQTGGALGLQDYTGKTWLRGYQITDINGVVQFTSIYPGWYSGRATHIHFEVFINNKLRGLGQIAFPETFSAKIHATAKYAAHGVDPTSNMSDSVFGNSATDLANEIFVVRKSGTVVNGTYTIGLPL